jgi:hypothetical protein
MSQHKTQNTIFTSVPSIKLKIKQYKIQAMIRKLGEKTICAKNYEVDDHLLTETVKTNLFNYLKPN